MFCLEQRENRSFWVSQALAAADAIPGSGGAAQGRKERCITCTPPVSLHIIVSALAS